MKTYELKNFPVLTVKDSTSVKFHAQADDYFGTLATTLSLWKQTGVWPETEYQELQQDLQHLHQNYTINKKLG